MIKRSSITIVLLCAILAVGIPIPSYAGEGDGGKKGAAYGCASGAVAGSIVPILGNIVGCVVGGVAGWFLWPGSDKSGA